MAAILTVALSPMATIAHAQTPLNAGETWQRMLSAKYEETARPSGFTVVERARSGQTLTYAHQEGKGWWMCFDDRPSPSGARVEVDDIANGRAEASWITHGLQPSRAANLQGSEEQRTMTLAIFNPGSQELGAVPVEASTTSSGAETVTVQAGREMLRYELDSASHLPVRIEIRVPYHKLFPKGPDLPPGAMTSTTVELRTYVMSDGDGRQPSSIILRGVTYSVQFEANPQFPASLFSLPISPSFQTPDAWRGGTNRATSH